MKEYILRNIQNSTDFIDNISFFKEGDNTLFEYLDLLVNINSNVIVVTTKQNFSTIGKVICTITEDNQVLKDNMLIPSECNLYEPGSYLLEYNQSNINVICIDEMQKMPQCLLSQEISHNTINIFDEQSDSLKIILEPIAQTYDVHIDIVNIIDGWTKINITSKKYGNISQFVGSAKQLFPSKIIATANIVKYIIDKLTHTNKKITFAESCTGGLLSYYFTKENGASNILDGSLVTYSNIIKENWLAVDENILKENGAVSAEVVSEMSEGAINVSSANYALSISGIAGEGGGTEDKPVGTVYIGVRTQDKHEEIHLNLHGDRNYIQSQSVLYAIKLLLLIDKEMFFEI
ncbi:MAG: CinA family protein [Sulfurimonas sp.]|nr:CinA family protein [Sulfurimonas sp.]